MIPFAPPRIDENTISAVTDVLKSGWITTGPVTKNFEKQIAEYCNVDKVLAVNSWTAGAEMLLKWFGIQEGDEVIVPAYTYCATVNIIIHCGAKPVLIDCDKDFNININLIQAAITERTKAIITVDIGGFPVDYEQILKIISTKESKEKFKADNTTQEKLGRILFLADAAHSFGAVYKYKKVGSIADFTVFSFHAVKNLTTAEGGAICISLPEPFNNSDLYKELNIWSLHGQTKDALAKTQVGAWEYDIVTAGYKCNMTDILAAIGSIELERYSETLRKREYIFCKYTEKFSELENFIVPKFKEIGKESSYHLYMLRIKNISLKQRNAIIQEIFNNGVSVNVHYKPIPLLSFYKNLGYALIDYPMSNICWENEISLPVFYDMTDTQINLVIETVITSYKNIIN